MARSSVKSAAFTRTILSHIHEYISGQGYFYTKQDIANFYLSLRTRPFVILAGISGTGKTQLVRQFAAAIGAADRCTLIPVKPDWTDHVDLLGYTDLNGQFQRKELLEVILEAVANPREVFFVILDEMNLARVEYYFSDFLSVMETREKKGKHIQTVPLLTRSHFGTPNDSNRDLIRLGIPDNLYIVGTVNIDETTHPFSRKVLDRANSIEMNEVQLDWPPVAEQVEPLSNIQNDFLRAPYVHIRDVKEADRKKVQIAIRLLTQINKVLREADLQIGYRIRDEVVFYMLNRYEIRELISEKEALDFQILQKILPRIHGSSRRIKEALNGLLEVLLPAQLSISPSMQSKEIRLLLHQKNKLTPAWPKSVEKLLFMLRRMEEDGFTSFWI